MSGNLTTDDFALGLIVLLVLTIIVAIILDQ